MTLLNSLKLSKETKTIVNAMFQEKLKDLPENGWQKVYTILLKWCKFLGIKEVPDREDMKMILFFMKKEFGDLTLDEVVNAFNLGVARKLDIDPNHYQNFSPLYVGGILNAYKEYKKSHVGEYLEKSRAHEEKILSERNKPTEEELNQSRLDSLLSIWDDFKNGEEEEVSWQAYVYYDILVDANLVDFSSEEKKEILLQAKKLCKQDAHRDVKNEFTRKRILDEINKHTAKTPNDRVINRCKLLATQQLFENLIREGLDLRDKLNLTEDDRLEIAAERGDEDSPMEEV